MIFYAQAEMDEAGITDPEKLENLNFAKRCLISGLSYTDLAAFETDTTESIQLYSQATSNFCRAQRYAQLVIEDSAHYIYAE